MNLTKSQRAQVKTIVQAYVTLKPGQDAPLLGGLDPAVRDAVLRAIGA